MGISLSDWYLYQKRMTTAQSIQIRNSEYKIKSVLSDYRKCSITIKSKARNMRTCKQLFFNGFRLGLYLLFLFILCTKRLMPLYEACVGMGIWLSFPFGNLSHHFWGVSIQCFIFPALSLFNVTLFSYVYTLTFPLFNRKHFNLPICLN